MRNLGLYAQAPLIERAIRIVIISCHGRLRSMEGDYGSGKSFITSPVTIYFLRLLGNDDEIYEIIYEVIYGVVMRKSRA